MTIKWEGFSLLAQRGMQASSTTPSLILFFLCSYFFLWVPDLDQALLSILHHRSIVTHSVLPALLLLLLRHSLGVAPAAGALIAISVHLACDSLSPAVGFGQVWLPAPFKIPLGAWSHLWLIGNAVLSFWLAVRMARLALGKSWSTHLVIGTAALVGASYGIINESSLLAAVASLILPGAAYGLGRRQKSETAYQKGRS